MYQAEEQQGKETKKGKQQAHVKKNPKGKKKSPYPEVTAMFQKHWECHILVWEQWSCCCFLLRDFIDFSSSAKS